ncbi:hypothetical protein PN462_04160 [Spirulina sp. CS-785/01]|uniref:hypothetical protein n=1 Tax=Spirulina sp. CS-785/01 TaxID=3021716 RepID=UPI00232ABE55|nr:hypothetical protein [Spirulina sp. CS-785/01]MDB9312287.1 hypothetical protein [Spirulina sp. CS-785/01]
MFLTVESRWFFPGDIPPDIQDWYYHRNIPPLTQPPRTDYYLQLENEALGIKLREGRIEVKHRTQQYGLIPFSEQVQGNVEEWQKWSFNLTETPPPLVEVENWPNWWPGVRKERKLRKFQVTRAQQVQEVSFETPASQSCEWELTRLSLLGKEDVWWTMGFEASGAGDADIARETLLCVMRKVLTEGQVIFSAEQSCGYPQWLKKLDN